MNFDALDEQLRETFADVRLSNEERDELRQLGTILDPDRIRFLRNRAFAMTREMLQKTLDRELALQSLKWLEQVIKTLDQCHEAKRIAASAHFTPGDACRQKIIALCRSAKYAIDVCVFTISDDRLSSELIACHKKGVKVRIITDDEKQYDAGSDVQELCHVGIPLRTDDSPYHMHHKFAVFDRKILLNGSFNWTASASDFNAENIAITDNVSLVEQYLTQFEKLWKSYE